MANGGREPGDDGPGRPRPSHTIDLTATEIAREPVAPEAPAAARAEQSRPAQAPEPERREAGTPPPQPDPSKPKSITWLPVEPRWGLIGAGVLGGALVLVLLGGLWLAGALARRDEAAAAQAARLAVMEGQLRALAARPVPVSIDPKTVDELAARLGRIEGALAARPAVDPAVAQRLTAIESATKALGETLAARIAVLERVPPRAAGDGRAATDDKALRLVVGAAALRSAVERGDPFAAELAAVKPLAADSKVLASLEPFAATGVPAVATLAHELVDLIPSLQQAAGGAPSEAGFFGRLQTNAGRLVRIRPVDEVPGDDPATIIARIEVKAGQADLAGALAELAKLPASARAPAEAWKKKAEARAAAIEASRRFAADALAALGRPSP